MNAREAKDYRGPVDALVYRIVAFNAGGHGYEVTVAGSHPATADAVASRPEPNV